MRKQKQELDRLEAAAAKRSENAPQPSPVVPAAPPAAAAAAATVVAPSTGTTASSAPVSPTPPTVPSRLHRRRAAPPPPPPQTEMKVMPSSMSMMESIREPSSGSSNPPKYPHNPKSASFQLLPSMLIVPDDDSEYGIEEDTLSENQPSTSRPDSPVSPSKTNDVSSPVQDKRPNRFSRWVRKRSNSQQTGEASFELTDVSPGTSEEQSQSPTVSEVPPPVPRRRSPPPVPTRPKPQIPPSKPIDTFKAPEKAPSPSPTTIAPVSSVLPLRMEQVQLFPSDSMPELDMVSSSSKSVPKTEVSVAARTPPFYRTTSENPLDANSDSDEDDLWRKEDNPPEVKKTVIEDIPKSVDVEPVVERKDEEESKSEEQQVEQNNVLPDVGHKQEEEGQEEEKVQEEKKQIEEAGVMNGEESLIPEPAVTESAPAESAESTDLWGERSAEDAAIEAMLETHQEEHDGYSDPLKEPYGFYHADEGTQPLLPEEHSNEGVHEAKFFYDNHVEEPFTEPESESGEGTVPDRTTDTTMTTSAISDDTASFASEDVPPPRPPKLNPVQRQSSEIFPDEQQPAPDPFAILASPTKDTLMDELFGAPGSPDDDFSQSPVHFESVHRRAPPPPSQSPQRPPPPPKQHSSSQIRASLSETADRFKKWLK